MPVRRHFLPWDRPLLGQAVSFLAGDWNGAGPLDLSRLLVVVPTRQSGRRLREALAAHASGRRQAVFAPLVLTPDALLNAASGARAAGRLESLLAWTGVLQSIELESFREVFLLDPPLRNFGWAARVATELLGVQASLAEGGLRLAGVAIKAGADFVEIDRWRQIAELEKRYDERLRAKGLVDAQQAKISAAGTLPAPPGIERIAILATPDPLPLATSALAGFARTLPVDVVVFAPPDEAPSFDEWGRPIPAAWNKRALEIAEFEERVRLCADPAGQAEEICALAGAYGEPEGALGLGLADGEVLSTLESALRASGFEVFNPDPEPRSRESLHGLLSSLAELSRDPAFENIEAIGRNPAFLDFLAIRLGPSFSPARWLAGLDELRLRHLPADISAARARAPGLRAFPELEPGLAAAEEVRAVLGSGTFAEGATAALASLFGARNVDLAIWADTRLAEGASAWMRILRECAEAAPDLPRAEAWELSLKLFGEETVAAEKPEGALELQGWLELLWDDSPHLVVAGLNDGSVPEAVGADAFLPESLRETLGLKTNSARLARDAYQLQALASSRGRGGRLDLLFGKASSTDEPLKPSRLLFLCPEPDLPRRTRFLFRPLASARRHSAWRRAWRLVPPRPSAGGGDGGAIAIPSRIAVTALRDWLACPFRFYLRHVLGMAPFNAAKTELDDLDFGTLCHSALEAMGRRAELRDCTDPRELREFLSAELDRRVRSNFGENLSLPLLIQREAARQRLSKAADVQARERASGWRIDEVEKKVAVEIGGLVVSGKIDRVDRNVDTGAIRVLDYKTSDAPVSPAQAHFRAPKPDEAAPDWVRCEWAGKPRVWSDLQLPFYRRSLTGETPAGVDCGYFNLPKAAAGAGIELWEDYLPAHHESAMRCAEGVCRAIRAGEFWPPNEEISAARDDFAELFHRGVAESVVWKGAP